MNDIILAHEVPKRALMALAMGMQDPEEVLRVFDYTDAQIAWLLQDPNLDRLVQAERVELEKSGAMDAARVRMHAVAQMELCTKRAVAGLLREVDVKYLDVLMRGANLGAIPKGAEGPAVPQFSIQFILKPPGHTPTTIDVTPTLISELTMIELPTEEFS